MKKYKWIFLIIAGGIFLVTVLKSKGCGEIKQEDFIKDFHQQNVEIISDLSKVSNIVRSKCNDKVELEFHLNQDKLFVHICNQKSIDEKERDLIFKLMKEHDINRIYSINDDIFFQYFKVTKNSRFRPSGVMLVNSQNFLNSGYEVISKEDNNWCLVKKLNKEE